MRRAHRGLVWMALAIGGAAACGDDGAAATDAGPVDAPDVDAPVDAATPDAIDATVVDAAIDAGTIDAAPPGTLRWSRIFGGSAFDYISAMVATSDGGVVIAGYTYGRIDLGGGLVEGLFLARYDAGGAHLWSRGFAWSAMGTADVSLAINTAGDLYVAVEVNSGMVDPGTGPLAAIGTRDALLVRFGADGTPRSARRLGGAGATVIPRGIAVDAAGDVIAVGVFDVTPTSTPTATIDLGNGTITGAGTSDAWVAGFDATLATTRWSRRVGAPVYPDGNLAALVAIEPATQDAVVCGTFTRTTDLGGGPRQATGNGVGVPDLFLLALHGDGTYAADLTMGGTASEDCASLRIDATGRRWMAGSFNGTTTLGGQARTVRGFRDGYALALDGTTAAYLLTVGTASQSAAALDHSPGGFVIGGFGGTIDLGGIPLTAANFGSGFVARLGATGTAAWAHAVVSSGGGGVSALAETPAGAIVAGRFEGQVTFDGVTTSSTGVSDVFLAAYAP